MLKERTPWNLHKTLAILYSTVDTRQCAETLAKEAIQKKYAACVNVIPGGTSFYDWNQNVEQAVEYYVVFKTTSERLLPLETWLLENHPYDVPAILKWHVEASKDFYNYILKSLDTPEI